MNINKWYLAVGAVLLVVTVIGYNFTDRRSALDKFVAGGPVQLDSSAHFVVATNNFTPNYCPGPHVLVKQGLRWVSQDGRWETHTPSSATEILNFIGAQWLGIKVGKIICLYQTNEEVSFPLALEQTRAQAILEPREAGWGPLISNHRLCKSASIADCPYYIEPPREVGDIFEEIRYAPRRR
jgi:hypothetical protein